MRQLILLMVIVAGLVLAACGNEGENAGGGAQGDPAARAVEDYLSAKVQGDEDTIRAGLCSEMESVLERELRTFESVADARIENMSCASEGTGTVHCQGEIVALYGTEETKFPLGAYRVVEEDGVWRWCGETQ